MKSAKTTSRILDFGVKKDLDVLNDYTSINARSARSNFSRLINNARIERDVVVITDHGEPAAAVISIRELKLLDRILEKNWRNKISNVDFTKMSSAELRALILGRVETKDWDGKKRPGGKDAGAAEDQRKRMRP